jgi:type II secretory pathway pseudopilin PulG
LAVTLVEALVAGLVLALGLWLLTGLYERGLDTARTRQAGELLRTLNEALAAYYDAAGAYLPGQPNGSAERVLNAMLEVPASAEVLGKLAVRLLHRRDGRVQCLDPWGKPPRYVTLQIGEMDLRRRVAHNQGKPIFESAGPDGRFGHTGDAAAADDVRTDEPVM